jgi:hypothetical protein
MPSAVEPLQSIVVEDGKIECFEFSTVLTDNVKTLRFVDALDR